MLQTGGWSPDGSPFFECLDSRLCHWLLPAWFYKQANPQTADFTVSPRFKNETSRRWTTLRPGRSGCFYHVDQYGVVTCPEGHSLEVWLFDGEGLIVPNGYDHIAQTLLPEGSGLKTIFRTGNFSVVFKAIAAAQSSVLQLELEVNGAANLLRPIILVWVIRPYSQEGLARIQQLAYDRLVVYVNRKPGLILDQEPSHSFFANETNGDLDRFFQEQLGNLGSVSRVGLCTGLVGYAGLPEQLGTIRLQVAQSRLSLPGLSFGCRWQRVFETAGVKMGASFSGRIRAGTPWDSFYEAGAQHLKTFSPETEIQSVDIHQLLVLNRLGLADVSGAYLKKCFMKVQINGNVPRRWLGTEKFIYGVADYYRYSGDRRLAEAGWPVLKRIGFHMMQHPGPDDLGERGGESEGYWACASLRELAELANALGKLDEMQLLKEWYLEKLHHQYRRVAAWLQKEDRDRGKLLGARLLHALGWSFPLHLWDDRELEAQYWLETLSRKFLWKGGFFAPLEFKGVDLASTVKFCQRLVWFGREYMTVLRFIMAMASTNWSWPSAVNPLTGAGIGSSGHDPQMLYQMLLLWRLIFVNEVGEELYLLPGIFNDPYWDHPQIKLEGLLTSFGPIAVSCHRIGNIIQITIDPQFTRNPKIIKLKLNSGYQLISADAPARYGEGILEVHPAVHRIRFKKELI